MSKKRQATEHTECMSLGYFILWFGVNVILFPISQVHKNNGNAMFSICSTKMAFEFAKWRTQKNKINEIK